MLITAAREAATASVLLVAVFGLAVLMMSHWDQRHGRPTSLELRFATARFRFDSGSRIDTDSATHRDEETVGESPLPFPSPAPPASKRALAFGLLLSKGDPDQPYEHGRAWEARPSPVCIDQEDDPQKDGLMLRKSRTDHELRRASEHLTYEIERLCGTVTDLAQLHIDRHAGGRNRLLGNAGNAI